MTLNEMAATSVSRTQTEATAASAARRTGSARRPTASERAGGGTGTRHDACSTPEASYATARTPVAPSSTPMTLTINTVYVYIQSTHGSAGQSNEPPELA